MEQIEPPGTGEPTVCIVIAWVAAVSASAGLLFVTTTAGKYPGMENIGYAVAGILAWALTIVSSAVGLAAAGIGFWLARRRQLRILPLDVALGLNFLLFWIGLFLPMLVGRGSSQ